MVLAFILYVFAIISVEVRSVPAGQIVPKYSTYSSGAGLWLLYPFCSYLVSFQRLRFGALLWSVSNPAGQMVGVPAGANYEPLIMIKIIFRGQNDNKTRPKSSEIII